MLRWQEPGPASMLGLLPRGFVFLFMHPGRVSLHLRMVVLDRIVVKAVGGAADVVWVLAPACQGGEAHSNQEPRSTLGLRA